MRILVALLVLLSACSRPASPPPASARSLEVQAPFWKNVPGKVILAANDPQWEKRRWLEKTVRLFRAGEGLRAGENAEELLRLDPQQLVDRLQRDPRFADTVLDFNLYFLGFKPDRVKPGKTYDQSVYDFPAAVQSAREVLANGDYFKLFDLEGPLVLPRVVPLDKTDAEYEEPNLDVFKRRHLAFEAGSQEVLRYAKSEGATTAESCQRFEKHMNDILPLILMGIPQDFIIKLMLEKDEWYGAVYEACDTPGAPPAQAAAALEKAYGLDSRLFQLLEAYADEAQRPTSVADIKPFPLKEQLGIETRWLSWGLTQYNALKNSSTNMDRKRAAYVLKRFFCDDLTPVGIEDLPNHGGGEHGSQASCKACHYKLDPMAGYFRYTGRRFRDYSQNRNITFDDGVRVNLQQYMSAWKAPAGSPREWNVGYVRSVTDESLNDYGSTLPDLHASFRRLPEVKACLVRRAFEYAVGDSQTIDPGYLHEVAKEFGERSATDSSGAVRWLFAKAALSNTFRQPQPESDQCYDYRPGTDPSRMPPCRVAYLLEQNCKSCHKSTADHGSLSLVEWTPGPDGRLTFPHLGPDGQPLPLRQTLEHIVRALTTTDPEERMPKGQFMTAQDRQALYLWAQRTLEGLSR